MQIGKLFFEFTLRTRIQLRHLPRHQVVHETREPAVYAEHPVRVAADPGFRRVLLQAADNSLGDVFGQLIRDLLQITSGSSLSDVVEVVDS